MSVNVELLDRTLAHIEAHPEEWDQSAFRCGTSACFAGWAALLAGGRWLEPDERYSVCMVPTPDDPDDDLTDHYGVGACVNVEYRARRVLGISDVDADELFSARNTLDDLSRIVAGIKAGAS